MQKLLFLCISCAILVFSIIVVNIGPILGGLVGGDWHYRSCTFYSDNYKYTEKENYSDQKVKDKTLSDIKKEKTRCDRKKAMVGLEYVAFDLNIIFGGICGLLGLFIVLKVGDVDKIIGLIGLGCGVVGFVLTLVYVIESGLVFTDIVEDRTPKIDSDGVYLEWDESLKSYTCKAFKKGDEDSIYLKYSDLGNKFLSYYKEIFFYRKEKKESIYKCNAHYIRNNGNNYNYPASPINFSPPSFPDNYESCEDLQDGTTKLDRFTYSDSDNNQKNCDKIYYFEEDKRSNENKIIYDRWITSIILSCFIILLNIGLAIFGFLVFNGSGKTNL